MSSWWIALSCEENFILVLVDNCAEVSCMHGFDLLRLEYRFSTWYILHAALVDFSEAVYVAVRNTTDHNGCLGRNWQTHLSQATQLHLLNDLWCLQLLLKSEDVTRMTLQPGNCPPRHSEPQVARRKTTPNLGHATKYCSVWQGGAHLLKHRLPLGMSSQVQSQPGVRLCLKKIVSYSSQYDQGHHKKANQRNRQSLEKPKEVRCLHITWLVLQEIWEQKTGISEKI